MRFKNKIEEDICIDCGWDLTECRQESSNANYCWRWDNERNLPDDIDPICLFHGKRWSEHQEGRCVFCCVCFEIDFEPWEDENGVKWDICVKCKDLENKMTSKKREGKIVYK